MNQIEHAKTREILERFAAISRIPRGSKNEARIAAWIGDWAREQGFAVQADAVKNTLVKVPGSPGYETRPIVVLQGHMDMVCEKTPDSPHDFTRDPIRLVYDGEWLRADRTTLGADNGIALAMAMVVATDRANPHPPLELLFTVDEETGLTGARSLQPGFLAGKLLVNLDSEDEGVFTVGCAGGVDSELRLPVAAKAPPAGRALAWIRAGGLKGGHSGLDIAKNRANAIRILGRTLRALRQEGLDVRIAALQGGSAHNAIPRDAAALVLVRRGRRKRAAEIVGRCRETFRNEFRRTDPDLAVAFEEAAETVPARVLTPIATDRTIDFLLAVPHGVEAMSADIPGLVQTSNNFARIRRAEDAIEALTSQRSSVVSEIDALSTRIEGVARLAGGEGHRGTGYPPWTPNMESPLLARSKALYRRMFAKEPVVEVIHAGLECGLIADRNPGMDMISIGPDLKDPHCPDERVHIGSIGRVWEFLAALLKEIE
ncbi:MAG: aminoacyl-histidine dipeptidase [Planctomycetota bacterium]